VVCDQKPIKDAVEEQADGVVETTNVVGKCSQIATGKQLK